MGGIRCEGEEKNPPSPIQRYVELVLSTRHKLEDPDLDQRLVTAASNAISILSYAHVCGLTEFHLSEVGDFSHCRIPYANFNSSSLFGCRFDYGDLTQASFYQAYLRGASFKHAKLRNATTCAVDAAVDERSAWQTVEISRDEKQLVVLTRTSDEALYHAIQIWEVETMKLTRELDHVVPSDALHYDISISPDSTLVAFATDQTTMVSVWDVETGELRFQLGPHAHGGACVAFHPDGKSIATGTVSGSVYLWDLGDGDKPACRWTVSAQAEHTEPCVMKVTFSPDGSLFAQLLHTRKVHVCNAATGETLTVFTLLAPPLTRGFYSMAFSEDSRYFATQTAGNVQLRDLQEPDSLLVSRRIENVHEVFTESAPNTAAQGTNQEGLVSQFARVGVNLWQLLNNIGDFVAFFPDGRRGVLASGSIRDLSTESWNSNLSRHLVYDYRPVDLVRSEVAPFSLSPDGSCLVVIAESFARLACPIEFHRATWTSDSASVLLSADHMIFVLDVSTCQITQIIAGTRAYRGFLQSLAGTNAKQELSRLDHGIRRLTDVELARVPHPVPLKGDDHRLIALVLATDGRPSGIGIVSLDDTSRPLRRIIPSPFARSRDEDETATERMRMNSPANLQLSPNGQYLGVVFDSGSFAIWNLASESDAPVFRGVAHPPNGSTHNGYHQRLAFSPDNRHVACRTAGREIRLWDFQSSSMKLRLELPRDSFSTMHWSADGRLLVTCVRDWIRFWDVETGVCAGILRGVQQPGCVMWSPGMNESITAKHPSLPMLHRWRLEIRPPEQQQQQEAKQPLKSDVGSNWRISVRATQVKCFQTKSGVFDADYEEAELNPAFRSCVDRSTQRFLKATNP